jgi:hypothetical protein
MNAETFPQPAQVDYEDPKAVVEYLRALLDLYDLLGKDGYDEELQPFLVKLREKGWPAARISEFIQLSSYHTRYEGLIDPPFPSQGDAREYQNNSYRWRH